MLFTVWCIGLAIFVTMVRTSYEFHRRWTLLHRLGSEPESVVDEAEQWLRSL